MDRSAVAVKQRHVSRYRPFLFLGQNKSKEAAPVSVHSVKQDGRGRSAFGGAAALARSIFLNPVT